VKWITTQHSPSILPRIILKAIACDVVIVAAAAAVAWSLLMRTLTGFGVELVWTGGAAGLTGGLAALAQWALTGVGQASDMDPGGPRLDRGLGRGDPVLEVLRAIAGSGAFWMITGGLITKFVP